MFMCPAVHMSTRSLLRSSSTHKPSDPPLRVEIKIFYNFIDNIQRIHQRQNTTEGFVNTMIEYLSGEYHDWFVVLT